MAFLVLFWTVLGSQGIVVKCTAAIFFPTEDSAFSLKVFQDKLLFVAVFSSVCLR